MRDIILILVLLFVPIVIFSINYVYICGKCNRNTEEKEKFIPNYEYDSDKFVENIENIREYDYRKLTDPLVEPTRRIDIYSIPQMYMKNVIDIPSRGYPDSYTQFGILTSIDRLNEGEELLRQNGILKLYGRQTYPGSSFYEYYTALNSGLDQIKIPLDIKRDELYDGDIVNIKEIGGKYRVKLYRYDAPKYYPDLI